MTPASHRAAPGAGGRVVAEEALSADDNVTKKSAQPAPGQGIKQIPDDTRHCYT